MPVNWMKSVRGGQLKVLSQNQIEDVHFASLEILESTGVKVMSDRGLKILEDSGADVDHHKRIARILRLRQNARSDVVGKTFPKKWERRFGLFDITTMRCDLKAASRQSA